MKEQPLKKKQNYLELSSDELLSKASTQLASEAATSDLDPFEYLEDCFPSSSPRPPPLPSSDRDRSRFEFIYSRREELGLALKAYFPAARS